MTPELQAALLELGSDAIKILGPAAIAAWVGYSAGQAQLKTRLKELELANGFKAREHLYAHYETRRTELKDSLRQLGEMIGRLTSELSAEEDEDESPAEREAERRLAWTLVSTLSSMVPLEVSSAKSWLSERGLAGTPHEARLDAAASKADWTVVGENRDEILDRALLLFDMLTVLAAHSNTVLGKKAEELFVPHLGPPQ